jgi:C1A family cysteine protease
LDKFKRAVSVPSAGGVAGNPPGHAMLVVGYDKRGQQPFFIVKNSWGPDKGDHGYFFLSYEYFSTYVKVGYIITDVRIDMTANI